MNPRLRSILIAIGLLTLVIAAVILVPRGLSIYYQSRGGQHIDYVMRSVAGVEELVCEPLPEAKEAATEEVENGIENLNRAVRFNRRNAHAYYQLGKAYCLLGEPEKALRSYQQYTQLRPDNPLGHIGLGFVYEALGEEEESKEAWISAGLDPQEFNAVGDEFFGENDFDGALEWYERALLVDPETAESWIDLGDTYKARGQSKEAIDAYSQAWIFDPDISIEPLILAYQEKGNFIAVEDHLEEVLDRFPNSSHRLYWYKELGESYRIHGDHDQAIEIYLKAIAEFPDRPYLHINLGWTYFDQGVNYHLAVQEFEKTLQLDDSIAEGYYGLARINSRLEKYYQADEYFDQAIARSPDNRWYFLEKGNNLRNAGEVDSAIKIYTQVITMYPDFAYGYYQLAQAHMMQGLLDDAISSIELAIDYSDHPTDQFYSLAGNIYRAAGLIEKAVDAYQLALSINPNNEIAVQGLISVAEND